MYLEIKHLNSSNRVSCKEAKISVLSNQNVVQTYKKQLLNIWLPLVK